MDQPQDNEGRFLAAPSTHIRDRRADAKQGGELSDRQGVTAALRRLAESERFDEAQLQVIESEMHALLERQASLCGFNVLDEGTQVGRFVIDVPLGRGGEGSVFRGHDAAGLPAAIKILHNMRVSDRFRREMHLVRKLAHPNIVTAYEVGEYRGLPFITMELLKGPDLHELVCRNGPLDWADATRYIVQAARALMHAHRRDLIHRDIKPGNLLLNGRDNVKLVDLGLAAICGSDESQDSVFRFETQEGHLAGTIPYMAPEQARSLANATVRSDIYALGATWFYLLTGRERLRGKAFAAQFENLLVRRRFNALPADRLPRRLREIYQRMVAYDVEDRYGSCETLVRDIEAAMDAAGASVADEGIDVLVVEDSQTDMLHTINFLRRSNSTLTIHQARTLADGIEACRNEPIDLVLLDLSLPDSMGVETVTSFREAVESVPVVVLTGMKQDEVGADCLAAGADTFISKDGLTAHRMERTIFVTISRYGIARRGSATSDEH